MAQRMQRHAFLIPAASAASWNRRLSWRVVIGLPRLRPGNSQRSSRRHARIVPRWARLPPLPQQIEHLGRQHHVAVLAALGLLDANDVLRAVDVA